MVLSKLLSFQWFVFLFLLAVLKVCNYLCCTFGNWWAFAQLPAWEFTHESEFAACCLFNNWRQEFFTQTCCWMITIMNNENVCKKSHCLFVANVQIGWGWWKVKCLTGWLNYSPKVSGSALLSETENLFSCIKVKWDSLVALRIWAGPLQNGRFHCTKVEFVMLGLANTQGMAYMAMAEL